MLLSDIFDARGGELFIYPAPRFRPRALTFGRRSWPSARGGAMITSQLRCFFSCHPAWRYHNTL